MSTALRRWPRRFRDGLLVGALVASVVALPAPPHAAAGQGLRVEAHTTWTLEADATSVHVTIDASLTNLQADEETEEGVTSFFYETLRIGLPLEATNVTAQSSTGTPLTVVTAEVEPTQEDEAPGLAAIINLVSRLDHLETQRLTVRFELPGSPPRSESRVRVNPAYGAFDARAWGDPQLSTVEIRIADVFTVTTFGADVRSASDGAFTVYTADDIPDPPNWFVYVSARNDDGLEIVDAAVDDLAVRVLAWPGDNEWADEVRELVELGLPFLRDAIGLAFDPVVRVDILEARDPSLLGFAGWYIADQDRIEMGEVVDAHVVLHELTHLWFNARLFGERWINEGLAEVFGSHAVEALGFEADPSHAAPTPPIVGDPSAVTLNAWVFPDLAPAEDSATRRRELFGYNTSFWVMAQIADEVGIERLSAVVQASHNGEIAYIADGTPPEVIEGRQGDWRRLLDLLEERAGSAIAAELYIDHVVSPEDLIILDERTQAREAYAGLRDAPMQPPFVVRTLMDTWAFVEAEKAITTAQDVVMIAAEIAELVAIMDLGVAPSVVEAYEGAASTLALDASRLLAEDHLEAAIALAAAHEAVEAPRDIILRIGLIGSDVDGTLAESIVAYEAEDPATALGRATAVLDSIEGARDAGRLRAFWAGGIGLLILGGVVAAWVATRNRRKHG